MTGAAFFDLDRTLLAGASGPLISAALRAEGILPDEPIRGERLLFGMFNLIGETLPSMALTRAGVRATRGWSVAAVDAAGRRVADALVDAVQPYALQLIDDHREAGRKVVLATTTPHALVEPFAAKLGLDGVIATQYRTRDGKHLDGSVDGEFVWNFGKSRSVKAWARGHLVELADSYAYSDSVFDVPMLRSVGYPTAVNPDPRLWGLAKMLGWPIVYLDVPPGVPKPFGLEPQRVVAELVRPELLQFVDLHIDGLANLRQLNGAVVTPNHRSYLDPLVVAHAISRVDRPVRFLAKKEVTDAPIVGAISTAMGAIRVDRQNGTGDPFGQAVRSLRANELIAVFPQGTIPRGMDFFEPKLQGRYGAVRLAIESGCPVLPIGIWGTERAWPRNRQLPYLLNLADPPSVTVTIGEPYHPESDDLDTETELLMDRIVDLLPASARERHVPSEAELARTMPA